MDDFEEILNDIISNLGPQDQSIADAINAALGNQITRRNNRRQDEDGTNQQEHMIPRGRSK